MFGKFRQEIGVAAVQRISHSEHKLVLMKFHFYMFIQLLEDQFFQDFGGTAV